MSNTPKASKPTKVFFSYAHEDEPLQDRLAKHLKVLCDNKMIEMWHDRQINAGTEWEPQIDENLDSANIILLLVSSDFLDSKYCREIEMKRAVQRYESGEAEVIPIILRPCEWQEVPFGQIPLGKLQALPPGLKPVTSWENEDEAFAAIVRGIKRVIGGQDPIPPVPPNKRQKFRQWAIEEKHWPLLLSFIIPLYFVINYFMIDSGLHERTLLILDGIMSFIIGIFYWAIRRQRRRLWLSGFMGIVGTGLIVVALALPVCSLLRRGSNELSISVTIARFKPDDSTPRSYARNFNRKFKEELDKEESLFTIYTYNAEVGNKKQEEIDEEVESSKNCGCKKQEEIGARVESSKNCGYNVFVSAVVRRSYDKEKGEELADFNIHIRNTQNASDTQENAESNLAEPKNIIVKNQKSNSMVQLLVAYAYYKSGRWDDAIKILKQIREAEQDSSGEEKDNLRAVTYFYEGLCRLNKGLQISDDEKKISELETARDVFGEASSYSNSKESISLNITSQINRAYTHYILSLYHNKNEALNDIKSVIDELENLDERKKKDNNVKTAIGDCDTAKTNLILAYIRKDEIQHETQNGIPAETGDELLEKVERINNGFNENCLEYKGTGQLNIALLCINVGLRSEDDNELKEKLGKAIIYYEKAGDYFIGEFNKSKDSKARYLQNWITAMNNLASTKADLGTFSDKAELKRAKEDYEKVLNVLSKEDVSGLLSKEEYFDYWAWTKSNLAATLIKSGELNEPDGKDYEDAINVCREVINAYGQSQDEHWASAKSSLAAALCALGSRSGDQNMIKEALDACMEASEEFDENTKEWALNQKTWGDVYFQLKGSENLKKARQRYLNALSLCRFNNRILKKICSQIQQKI